MPSARSGIVALAAVAACAVVGLLAVALTDDRDLAFTLGVQASQPAAVIGRGDAACQFPIDASAKARSVKVKVGTYRRPGPPLEFRVSTSGEPAAGALPAGYRDLTWQEVRLDREVADERIAVCVLNRGDRRVALFGGPALAARASAAYVNRREQPTDIAMVFERGDSRSALSLLPTAFERAALWHPGWAGEWLFWVLLAAVVAGIPVLLAAALARAFRG
ncbi:MAG TPA: hypothetical protein VFB51_07250 [Solirubrobacterales bacterium]|nr:hypothetical protein [Solirubrobacterales bacterium]